MPPASARKTSSATSPRCSRGKHATFVHTYVNLSHGHDRQHLRRRERRGRGRELERIGFPFDEIQEVQFGASADDLRKMIGAG